MYATNVEGSAKLSVKKSKSVKRSVVKNEITFEDYRKYLFNQEEQIRKMNLIGSYNHEIYTIKVNKKVLSPNYDKRYELENIIETPPRGH